MRNLKLVLLLLLYSMIFGVACGGKTAGGKTAGGTTASGTTASGTTASGTTANGTTANGTTANGTTAPTSPPITSEEIVSETVETVPPAEEPDTAGCEDYFRFCTHVQLSGSINSEFTSGIGGNVASCTEWAAEGASHHLDLPMVQAFAQSPVVTVALASLGEYTGPGRYEMEHTKSGALPDAFPVVAVGDRTFERGESATAVAEIGADGSGTLTATGLVEIATMQNSSPDPNAAIDLTITWTCQE